MLFLSFRCKYLNLSVSKLYYSHVYKAPTHAMAMAALLILVLGHLSPKNLIGSYSCRSYWQSTRLIFYLIRILFFVIHHMRLYVVKTYPYMSTPFHCLPVSNDPRKSVCFAKILYYPLAQSRSR